VDFCFGSKPPRLNPEQGTPEGTSSGTLSRTQNHLFSSSAGCYGCGSRSRNQIWNLLSGGGGSASGSWVVEVSWGFLKFPCLLVSLSLLLDGVRCLDWVRTLILFQSTTHHSRRRFHSSRTIPGTQSGTPTYCEPANSFIHVDRLVGCSWSTASSR
jgi:hypothetical protein